MIEASSKATSGALPQAELVEPESVKGDFDKYLVRDRPPALVRSAWNHAELAMNQDVSYSDDLRQAYLDDANSLCGLVLNSPEARNNTRLDALVLSSYIPAFRRRALGGPLESSECHDVYRSLGASVEYLSERGNHLTQWRLAEVAVMALSARTGQPELLLYPGSPREEASPDGSYNHDSYFLDDDQKLPIQQKLVLNGRTYANEITLLEFAPLLDKTFRRHWQQEYSVKDQLEVTLAMLVDEAASGVIDEVEAKYLDGLARKIVGYRWIANRQQQNAP